MLSYDRLSTKPLLFKSFTGLTVEEFDDIYDNGISKRYGKHEIKQLFKRMDRERSMGASGRHFKVNDKKQVPDAACMLSPLHNLHVGRLSV